MLAVSGLGRVCAQQPQTLDTLVVTSSSHSGYYDSRLVSATRLPVAALDVPFSGSVVNQALLQDSLVQRLENLALFVSGVEQSSDASGFNTDLRIRGFTTGGRAYLDGVLDNQRFQVRDLALVERVEILKGHASVLYGSGSPGGTVNYITKKPLSHFQHLFSYAVGSYGFNRAVVDSSGPLTRDKSLLYRLIVTGQVADDFRENITHDRATVAPSLSWHYAADGVLNLAFEYSYQNQPYRFDNVFTQGRVVYDQSYVDPRTHSNRHYWRVSSSVTQKLWTGWEFHFAGHYYHVERDDLLFGFFTFQSPTTLSGYYRDVHDHYDQYNLRAEIRGVFDFSMSRHHLVAGVERNAADARLNSQRRIGGYTLNVYHPVFDYAIPSTSRLDRDDKRLEYGFYVNDLMDVGRFWHLMGGVRYSLFEGKRVQNSLFVPLTDQDALTFNAGLSLTPVANAAVYFGYSQSFQPNSGTDRNLKFLPARQGELYEFGVKSTWFERRLGVTSALYQLTQSHLPARDPVDPDFLVANGKVRSRGLELDINGRILDNLQVIANYSWMDSRFVFHPSRQGNHFRSTPEHSGSILANYRLPLVTLPGHFSLGGAAVFIGRRFGDDANSFEVPGYIRFDLLAHYQVKSLDFRLKLENVLDKRYVSSSIYKDTVIQGNRLTAFFKVAMRFD